MGPPRARSRVACQRCQGRKVKCDVAETTTPCTNCRQDGQACLVLPRKKHRPRRKRNASGELVSDTEATASSPYTKNPTRRRVSQNHRDTVSLTASTGVSSASVPDVTFNGEVQIEAGDEVLEDPAFDPSHPEAPQQARAAMLSRLPARKPHEIEYMRHQGVFMQLPDDVCDELIRCYFQHIHFFLPILDVPTFLNEYCSHRSQAVNSLLLWSVFLASANFADLELLERAGFSSRKAMKTAMYDRAKCLYDFDRGTDKLTLIRSVILLAFWYSDPQDHTGAWYWIGIAISLAQAVNLHRACGYSARSQKSLSNSEPSARRIWWSLVVRDRWIAVAKGRPMRIRNDCHDLSMPSREDVVSELKEIPVGAFSKFIPKDASALTDMWLRMVRISNALGDVLQLHYRLRGPEPSREEVLQLSNQLEKLKAKDRFTERESIILTHSLQVEMLYQATIAILCRPYILAATKSSRPDQNQQWKQSVVRRGREAASKTNNLLEQLIELDAIAYLKPMMITAMVPATQIHLADCKSDNSLIRGLGRNKLQLCILVYADLRSTYWSADVMYRLFQRAQNLTADHDAGHASSYVRPRRCSTSAQGLERTSEQLLDVSQQRSNLMPQPAAAPAIDPMVSFLSGSSPQLNDVDQLLSPGFALSEDVFLDFFPNYPTGNYDQTLVPNYY
ncbi:C6 transcription factor [Cordyceps javanica]|uniref:C6 transcription factor n=1 Tax=Cordyceps javanica TaxID=43265 RepID=A0A545VHB3_9HYPO|nr:C6 transcription factor [Cordyceps javanica]TQW12229.1 C6 transcription factor [Cordyceps javanica]